MNCSSSTSTVASGADLQQNSAHGDNKSIIVDIETAFSTLAVDVDFRDFYSVEPFLLRGEHGGHSLTKLSDGYKLEVAAGEAVTILQPAGLGEVNLQIECAAGAKLNHVVLQQGKDCYKTNVCVEGKAEYKAVRLSVGDSEHEAEISLDGEFADVGVFVANLVANEAKSFSRSVVRHKAENCTATVNVRNIVNDRAKASFNGKFIVEQQAQHTDASMLCKSLLLSERAQSYAVPELEIYADDVKCGHGSTCGKLDADALFYLESRGIGDVVARKMLTLAFIREVFEEAPDEVAPHLLTIAEAFLNGR